MPLNWSEYYYQGFTKVNEKNNLSLSDDEIKRSSEILKSFNPRLTGREEEIPPEVLFDRACLHWKNKPDTGTVISDFFSGMELHPKIFEYAFKVIDVAKSNGCSVAVLTDLPNGMPDEMFKGSIPDLLECIDLYVSSQSCGYRKPNGKGISFISDHYGVAESEILFVGDEEKDHKTALNAGCDFAYIPDFLEKFSLR